jgi:hypothetical protein
MDIDGIPGELHPNYTKEMLAEDGWSHVEYGPDGEPLPCEVSHSGPTNEDWIFSNTEPFQVKPKYGDANDDLWLVGRRGKPVIQVSRKDLNGGLGRPYHIDRIPWRLISIKIERWEDVAKKGTGTVGVCQTD